MLKDKSHYLIVLSTLFLVTSFVGILFYSNEYRHALEDNQKWVEHTANVLSKISNIDNAVMSLTFVQRGALITRDPESINEYNNQKKYIENNILNLKKLISDNQSQVERTEILIKKFGNLVQILDDTLVKNQKSKQTLKLSDQQALSSARQEFFDTTTLMTNEENDLLTKRTNRLLNNQYTFILIILGAVVLVFFIIILVNMLLIRLQHLNKKQFDEMNLIKFRLDFAMNASGEGLYDWNIKTSDVYYSDNFIQMLGYNKEEFGHTYDYFDRCVYDEDRAMIEKQISLFLKDKTSEYSIDFRMKNKNGDIVWVKSSASKVLDDNGDPVRLIGTHQDITASKTKEEKLIDVIEETEKQAQAKSSFLAHMSHEIRTPLTAITGIAEILQKQSKDLNEKQQNLVKTLSTSAQSLRELINDILDFSKIEKGEVEIDYAYFPLSDVIAEIISMMSVSAREKNIGFKVIDDNVKNVEYLGDKARIRQILLNLVGNAIKFTNDGQVTLLIEKSTRHDIESLDFIIQDTGIGIDEDALDTVFDEFQQGDKSVSREYGGTGLGLPISKRLALLMGGDISVNSKKHIGSTFTLTLPMADKYKEILLNDNENTNIKIADRLSSAIRGEQCALIVDDYEGNIVVLTCMMDDIGLQYDVARDGVEALEKWKLKHYDLILMDVQMPVMDGLTATQEIRSFEKDNNFDPIPIIGMTAHALVEDKQKCIDSGMTDYLPKPIDSQKLKERIYRHLYDDSKQIATA